MSNIIEKLKSDENYYGEFGSKYISNSDIGTLLKNPRMFKIRQEPTVPMIQGSYLHTAMLEPEKLVNFEVVEASTRNTNIYKDAVSHSSSSILLLKNEQDELDSLVSTMKGNFFFYENIYREGNVFEQPAVGEIFGMPFKGKADIVSEDILIDIKTTSDIDDFRWSAKKYNYDSQAYIYSQLFGKPLVFYVVCKKSHRLGVFEPSEDFVLGGRDKVMRAIEVYKKFFSKDATEDINNYFIQDTL
jgi:hypothetical protein